MKGRLLGFSKAQKLVISFQGQASLQTKVEGIKDAFTQHTSITGATASSNVLGQWMLFWRMWPSGEQAEKSQGVNSILVDYDFASEYEIEMVAGRSFQKDRGADHSGGGYILNEAAVEAFGWRTPEEAVGQGLYDDGATIIGVARNFHFKGLQSAIEPVALLLSDHQFRYLTLTVDTQHLDETIAFVERTYQALFPGNPLAYFFLDAEFDQQYRAEEQLSRLFRVFTLLGLFIACLGLFGLASFVAQQRTKEIGIRKVLGATVPGIVLDLTKDFVKWVALAAVLAGPIAWYLMNTWLAYFAYRTRIGGDVFVIAGGLALLVALLAVGYQSIKAALTNPVDALKYE